MTIRVRNSAARTVKTLKLGVGTVDKLLATSLATSKAGTYRSYVYATEAAGNARASVGHSKPTVR